MVFGRRFILVNLLYNYELLICADSHKRCKDSARRLTNLAYPRRVKRPCLNTIGSLN
jgi:hypothetical protein